MAEPHRDPFFVENSSLRAPRRRWSGALAAAAAATALVLLAPGSASAQTTPTNDSVKPDGKGIVGGAFLGAEVFDLTMGIIGINRGWPYLVFGAVGAIGGGIGGYFVEQNTRDVPEVALYMLAGGMGLVIPTLVVSLNATMYKPPEGTTTTTYEPANNAPATGPAAPGPAPGTSPVAPPTQTFRLRPYRQTEQRLSFSLIGMQQGKLAFSLPAVQVRPLYTTREMWTYGVQQGSEVRVPLFSAAF